MLLALLVVFGPELRASRHRGLLEGLPLLGLLFVGQRLADAWPRPSALVDPGALPAAYPRTDRALPDFCLTDQEGRTVHASDLGGEPVLLTFAYAHCGTVCPGLIATLRAVRSPARRVVVTLDPWRDTCGSLPDMARQWQLPAGSLVLSGEVEEVAALTRALDVPVLRDERTGEIEHPAVVFVLDRGGRIAYTFLNPSASWLEEALRRE
jgi:protein SCO1/2